MWSPKQCDDCQGACINDEKSIICVVPDCTFNNDCPPSFVCIKGRCTSLSTLVAQVCRTDSECRPWQTCVDKNCVSKGDPGSCTRTSCGEGINNFKICISIFTFPMNPPLCLLVVFLVSQLEGGDYHASIKALVYRCVSNHKTNNTYVCSSYMLFLYFIF